MDIQAIIARIELANFKEQAIDSLMDDITGINYESVKDTISGLKKKQGTLKTEESNKALDILIDRLERR
ncbi:hypothetical protein GO491_09470 [Flavobacteriaceae bacterium Ap0902]|nr:hypothetical protein [Flavobacteriaceae bacterium Ap0902]